ncbi:minor tail protein [Microbacterium phage Burro]|uniref:Minor tail protein n=1 Tax=Microbacterium phage Burro TaxID=2315703 RepID=A0A386KM88_9CAUD|nr:hypothetical protein HWB89_gp31 [Microbacterium phage Burro]AYD86174.1 minor tail protein [Microbacterium phage Burro]
MSYLGNTPKSPTILRLEQRKSFALALWIQDKSGRALDVTGATIKIVMKEKVDSTDTTDAGNMITNSSAEMADSAIGYVRFELQALDLNYDAGEYAYSIVMIADGYSSVLVSGTVELIENTELASVSSVYDSLNNASSLVIAMDGPKVINVFTGPTLAPGTTSFTNADKEKLDTIEPGAQVNDDEKIPTGGARRAYLGKTGDGDYELGWFQPPQVDPSGLDAEGIANGWVPTANGGGGWDWVESWTSADDVPDGVTNVTMTQAERTKLSGLTKDYTQLDNKPTLGTAAAQNTRAFLPSTGIPASATISGVFNNARLPRIGGILGNTYGTASPTGGSDGDVYWQLAP